MAGSYRPEGACSVKCRECICGIQNDKGMWCARLKKIPTPSEIKRCRSFCPKSILDKAKNDI